MDGELAYDGATDPVTREPRGRGGGRDVWVAVERGRMIGHR